MESMAGTTLAGNHHRDVTR